MAILPSSPAHELDRDVRSHELDVLLAAGALLHDLGGAELVSTVDDLQLLGEFRDEDGVLHRRVAAADHHHVLALEEGAVADAAGRNAASAELDLARDAEPLGLGAHREDHGLGAVGVLADLDGVDAAIAQLELARVVGDEAGAEALGLGAELVHHLRPHHALVIARVVLDVGGVLELAAPLEALDDKRLELGPSGIERGGVAGGAAADDDQVFDLSLPFACRSSRPFGAYPDPRLKHSVRRSYFTFYSSGSQPSLRAGGGRLRLPVLIRSGRSRPPAPSG